MRYRLVKPLEGAHPAHDQAILAARIDRLPPEKSVCYKPRPWSVLKCRCHSYRRLPICRRTTSTQDWPIFRRQSFCMKLVSSRVEYAFRHALSYQVAYNSLLRPPPRIARTHR